MGERAARVAGDVQEEKESRPPEVVLASILASLRAADSARERSELVRASLHAMARTVTAVIMFALLLCVALLELTIGALKWGSCPVSPWIPLWLVVSGILGILRNVSGILFSVLKDNHRSV
ncbi:hypothetical protein OESDEN_01280 [Oesophagostomum dentatum]|uniref:Uncharacterized protein n=1 Tax=Oesophagostomum dentatum TaxID=61180 RepID=A0A0B1TRL1_OESDE|nr:hypothetical protein OESDEN_01280 [Oesophagostomum dentatum]